jgi:hypothetical protein
VALYKVTQAFDVRLPPSLKGWKVVIAMGAAIILAPVVGLVLLFVVAALIPVLPLLATCFVRFWLLGQHSTLRRRPYDLPDVLRPRMSHASGPDP